MINLRYTPQAQQDLQDIRSYIIDELLNPSAAVNHFTTYISLFFVYPVVQNVAMQNAARANSPLFIFANHQSVV